MKSEEIKPRDLIRDEFIKGYCPIYFNGKVYRDSVIFHLNDREHQAHAIDETKSIVFKTLNMPLIWN